MGTDCSPSSTVTFTGRFTSIRPLRARDHVLFHLEHTQSVTAEPGAALGDTSCGGARGGVHSSPQPHKRATKRGFPTVAHFWKT